MTPRPDLSTLTSEEKDALIVALLERVAELEARLGEPPKTPGNSSAPPATGRKRNKDRRRGGVRREASVGRAGGGRRLHPNPDRMVCVTKATMSSVRSLVSGLNRTTAIWSVGATGCSWRTRRAPSATIS